MKNHVTFPQPEDVMQKIVLHVLSFGVPFYFPLETDARRCPGNKKVLFHSYSPSYLFVDQHVQMFANVRLLLSKIKDRKIIAAKLLVCR
jgi:hypothetical protein